MTADYDFSFSAISAEHVDVANAGGQGPRKGWMTNYYPNTGGELTPPLHHSTSMLSQSVGIVVTF